MCEWIMNLRKKTIHKDQPNKVTNYDSAWRKLRKLEITYQTKKIRNFYSYLKQILKGQQLRQIYY